MKSNKRRYSVKRARPGLKRKPPAKAKPMRAVRTYQNHVRQLKDLIRQMQWVSTGNGTYLCAACGTVRGRGCFPTCEAATITGDYGVKR